jgi:ATP/maltotriose-dependent transcriptional regulator MalT
MFNHRNTLPAILLGAALVAASAVSAQETQWQKDHPRRAEVNGRLANQDKRINQGEKSGKLTPGQANQLHREDRSIRKEERRMAAKEGGHITKKEQAKLNRQENQVSKQIHAEKHPK